MNVLLIGANGQIGRILTEKLEDNDEFNLTAAYRKDDQMNTAQAKGIRVAKIDLEKDIAHLERVMDGIDTVIFAAGSGGATGPDKTMMVDLDGAIKAIEAARRKEVKRFIMVSALNANRREVWSYGAENISPSGYYYAAKYYADEWLRSSGLGYTIIRPASLLNEAGTGKVDISDYTDTEVHEMQVPREDVASVILACLQNDNTINTSFDLYTGQDNIEEAVAEL